VYYFYPKEFACESRFFLQGILALYKGATPPAVGWAAIDSVLLGSLHNYRLFLLRHGMTEKVPGTDTMRLTLAAHGIAGLFAGLTR
jgi:solute carrier family 25 (mitochondrial carnitine/acylcarnitine transporter), member 20/29